MPNAGDVGTARLTVAPSDSSTLAALQVVQPDGTTVAGVPVSADGGHTWTAPVSYALAGEYRLYWTVTGTGAGNQLEIVQVGPSGIEPATGRRYATTTDLAIYLGVACPPDAQRMLRNATLLVDDLLFGAFYATDNAGEPTDPAVQAALRDAVCEQVAWWMATGDEDGAAGIFSSVSIGNVSLGRAAPPAGGSTVAAAQTRVAPNVRAILTAAGLSTVNTLSWG